MAAPDQSDTGKQTVRLEFVDADSSISKWERDLFRDSLSNVNQNLRYQISLGVPLIGACIAVLNVVPPQAHQELLNNLDRFVFIPAVLGMAVAYAGLESWWYLDRKRTRPGDDLDSLYGLIRHKYRMMHWAICLQALALCLLMFFVICEFK